MKFETLVPYFCKAGDTIIVKERSWTCGVPCTVIGVAEEGQPVLKSPHGPRLNAGELVPTDSLRTEGRQTYTETTTLGDYTRVNPKKLKGQKLVEVFYDGEVLILIGENKTYSKLNPSEDDGRFIIECDNLTMTDLRDLGQVDKETWAKFMAERNQKQQLRCEHTLKQAIIAIGPKRTKEVLNTLYPPGAKDD